MFTDQDFKAFAAHGTTENEVKKQLKNFETGFPFLKIKAAATYERGILKFSASEQENFIKKYDAYNGSKIKFVPASGAASRMFKALFEAKDRLASGENINFNDTKNAAVKSFFENIEKFAFYDDLKADLKKKNIDIKSDDNASKLATLNALLTSNGLNYGNLPKGLLLFHKYANFKRTAFEEHLAEAALYARNTSNKTACVHFTVSDEHKELFKNLLSNIINKYAQKYDVDYKINFSTQKKSTDTIAVDMENKPFRKDDGSILFRPGGHGALLENLNEIDADIVFVKNIDNVVPETKIEETVRWKKTLAGVLIELQSKIFAYLNKIDKGDISDEERKEIINFLAKEFCVQMPENASLQALRNKLNRPVRVCGMVKNEGEPGGGPFIIEDADGTTSLQILESSQINKNNARDMSILAASTHFNPVDLACAFKNYKGEKFNLLNYRDNSAGFISEKSLAGKALKAQELPGLWNGAMSNWNTAFVEVPIATFNPVKTVNDLLRKEHEA